MDRLVLKLVLVLVAGVNLLMWRPVTAGGQAPAKQPPGGSVPADIVSPGPPFSGWTAEAAVGRDSHVSDRATWRPWSSAEVLVARRFTGGSVGLGVMEVKRFGRSDGAVALEVYRALWSGAHGNVRAQAARKAIVLPGTDVSAEFHQGLTLGWETSLGIRRLGYDDPVSLTSLSLGKFAGDRWYGRVRVTRAERSGGSAGSSGSALVRRFLGSTREFVELAAGTGKEAVEAGVSATDAVVVDIRESGFVELGARKYLKRNWGVSGAGSYRTFAAIPARMGARVGVIARF